MLVLSLAEIVGSGYKEIASIHEILNKHGIYKIECLTNKHVYVGGTSTKFIRRWSYHIQMLKKGTHRNRHLQSTYDCHRELLFAILEVTEEALIQKEQEWLNRYEQKDCFICNIFSADHSSRREPLTEETKKKISEGQLRSGNKPTQAASQKAYEINRVRMLGNTRALGNKLSEEVKKAISERKMGNQNGKGYRHSPEAIERIRQASLKMWENRIKNHG
jgi:group I intron endonuclease